MGTRFDTTPGCAGSRSDPFATANVTHDTPSHYACQADSGMGPFRRAGEVVRSGRYSAGMAKIAIRASSTVRTGKAISLSVRLGESGRAISAMIVAIRHWIA